MAGDILILGDVIFDPNANPFSVPDMVKSGMGQMLGIIKTIGGGKTIDAMGQDPEKITWSGRWRAPDAVGNNDAMVAMAAAGNQVICTWGAYFYQVVVSKYTFDYEKGWEIPYSVELEVLPQAGGGGALSLGAAVDDDLTTALGVGFQ